MKKKKVLFLGGSAFQVFPIMYAKGKYKTILCDWGHCPGEKIADVFYKVSTTDVKALIKVCDKEKPDAIVCYASDPAALPAAILCEKYGLPTNPVSAVEILSDKNKFRSFLRDNNFHTPRHAEIEKIDYNYVFINDVKSKDFIFPVVVKPSDSSGSRGVTVVKNEKDIFDALVFAEKYSRNGKFIIEEYVEKKGPQIAGDGFVIDGKLVFRCFMNEHFDEGSLVPIGESYPCLHSEKIQKKVHNEIQRLFVLLGIKHGAFNFDVRIDKKDNVILMEIGPRNGGNLISNAIKYITGIDLIAATVEAAFGNYKDVYQILPNLPEHVKWGGYFSTFIIHGYKSGKYKNTWMSLPPIISKINNLVFMKKFGDHIERFTGSDNTIGAFVANFPTMEKMLDFMNDSDKYIRVEVE